MCRLSNYIYVDCRDFISDVGISTTSLDKVDYLGSSLGARLSPTDNLIGDGAWYYCNRSGCRDSLTLKCSSPWPK